MKNYKASIRDLEEKQRKEKEDGDAKAKANYKAFIQASRTRELNASVDQAKKNTEIVGSLYSIESNILNAKNRA